MLVLDSSNWYAPFPWHSDTFQTSLSKIKFDVFEGVQSVRAWWNDFSNNLHLPKRLAQVLVSALHRSTGGGGSLHSPNYCKSLYIWIKLLLSTSMIADIVSIDITPIPWGVTSRYRAVKLQALTSWYMKWQMSQQGLRVTALICHQCILLLKWLVINDDYKLLSLLLQLQHCSTTCAVWLPVSRSCHVCAPATLFATYHLLCIPYLEYRYCSAPSRLVLKHRYYDCGTLQQRV